MIINKKQLSKSNNGLLLTATLSLYITVRNYFSILPAFHKTNSKFSTHVTLFWIMGNKYLREFMLLGDICPDLFFTGD